MGRASCAWVAIAAVLATAMAGCTSEREAEKPFVLPFQPFLLASVDRLEAGAYAFRHEGGNLVIRATSVGFGVLNITLFGPNDEKLGHVSIMTGHEHDELHASALPGELVVVLAAVEGYGIPGVPTGSGPPGVPGYGMQGLSILSGATQVTELRRLAWVSGFAVLAQESNPIPTGWPVTNPRSLGLNTTIDTVPLQNLRVFGTGSFSDVRIEVQTPLGQLAVVQDPGSILGGTQDLLGGHRFWPLETTTSPENASGRVLTGKVQYGQLEGALIMSWSSYSRAGLAAVTVPAWAPPSAGDSFSYGTLGDGPLHVDVNPDATWLRLQESSDYAGLGEEAVVQVWAADGKRIGPIHLTTGTDAFIPVEAGGAFVFLVLNGTVDLGADRAPSDVDQHPLALRSTVFPRRGGGPVGSFMEYESALEIPGVPYAAASAQVHSDLLPTYCDDDAFIQLVQGGATIGSNLEGGWNAVSIYLSDAPLTLRATTFGDDGCVQPGVEILSFLPP